MDPKYRKNTFYGLLFILFLITLTVIFYLAEIKSETSNVHSLGDAFWYLLVTLTSVGYGDIVPVTFVGRVIGYFFILASLINLFRNKYMWEKHKSHNPYQIFHMPATNPFRQGSFLSNNPSSREPDRAICRAGRYSTR